VLNSLGITAHNEWDRRRPQSRRSHRKQGRRVRQAGLDHVSRARESLALPEVEFRDYLSITTGNEATGGQDCPVRQKRSCLALVVRRGALKAVVPAQEGSTMPKPPHNKTVLAVISLFLIQRTPIVTSLLGRPI
jgi:hypothetical protein